MLGFIFRYTAAGPPDQGVWAHYDVLEQIGQGSFATVYRVLHRATGQWYAAKFVYESRRAGRPQEIEQSKINLGREIAIMQKLDHPNICQLKEVFESRGDLSKLPQLNRVVC